MKIAVLFYWPVLQPGGLINHTEQLIGGFKDLGHEVRLINLVWKRHVQDMHKTGNFHTGPSGIRHDQWKGWEFKAGDRIAYRDNVASAKELLSQFDLLVWTTPVPVRGVWTEGNKEWPQLYDLPARQVAVIHDGNVRTMTSHISHIQDRLDAIACVHPCALNSASWLRTPRALVLNPQHLPVRDVTPWLHKAPGFISLQTFKAWKRVHDLVEAVAYMPPRTPGELRDIAGKGIEWRYLTSPDKCPYHHPDGRRFWDAAIANGMHHHRTWTPPQVSGMLDRVRVLVDPSRSTRHLKHGGHFNRVLVEAMIHGAVPIAHRDAVGVEMFKAGTHYVPLPRPGSGPQAYADAILDTGHMPEVTAGRYREAQLEVLPLFDRQRIAQQYIDLAFGEFEPAPHRPDPKVEKAAALAIKEAYGIGPEHRSAAVPTSLFSGWGPRLGAGAGPAARRTRA
jgi:glycosyltransferase involved in cell wall biosynthesis